MRFTTKLGRTPALDACSTHVLGFLAIKRS